MSLMSTWEPTCISTKMEGTNSLVCSRRVAYSGVVQWEWEGRDGTGHYNTVRTREYLWYPNSRTARISMTSGRRSNGIWCWREENMHKECFCSNLDDRAGDRHRREAAHLGRQRERERAKENSIYTQHECQLHLRTKTRDSADRIQVHEQICFPDTSNVRVSLFI